MSDPYGELWGLLCPDIGPANWESLIRWVAKHPNVEDDLQEARGLLERAMEWMNEPEHTNYAAEHARLRRQGELLEKVRVFLSRIAGGEGGETR